MATHIEMDDEYSQISTYHGTLDKKYSFVVEVSYNSNRVGYNIDSIEFMAIKREDNMTKHYWSQSEKRIKDFIMKWLFEEPKNQGESEDE